MSDVSPPAEERSILGKCPHCETTISEIQLLIRYESEGGWPKMYAECPACIEVVRPR